MNRSKDSDGFTIPMGVKVIDVGTGEFRVTSKPDILQSIALGSCIALIIYERKMQIGGIAHIMLPGASPHRVAANKYAENAIEALLNSVQRFGAKTEKLEISVVGGGNILQEGDIPDRVIDSVLSYLKQLKLEIFGMRIGGTERRSVFLNTTSGQVFYTEGENNTNKLLNKIERI